MDQSRLTSGCYRGEGGVESAALPAPGLSRRRLDLLLSLLRRGGESGREEAPRLRRVNCVRETKNGWGPPRPSPLLQGRRGDVGNSALTASISFSPTSLTRPLATLSRARGRGTWLRHLLRRDPGKL
jgi:hypothetical protein